MLILQQWGELSWLVMVGMVLFLMEPKNIRRSKMLVGRFADYRIFNAINYPRHKPHLISIIRFHPPKRNENTYNIYV